MGRIRPAGVRVLGVPMNKDTAVSLAKAARDVVLRRNVPPEIKEKRLKICQKCPHWTGSRCKKCGCQMKIKASLSSSECPIGQWGRYTDEIRE
jgi:hypothetical protein